MQQCYYSSFVRRFRLSGIFMLLFLQCAMQVYGEGSKELNQSGGYRPYLNASTGVTTTNPFPTLGTVKVYVNVGETIYLGSSAQGIGNGTINLRAPNGASYTTGSNVLVGRILSRSQELIGPSVSLLDGGYTAATVTVAAGQAGIWEIDFVPPNASNITNPTAILSTGNWAQPTSSSFIAAFDVSIRNTANTSFIKGRVYSNIYNANLGSTSATFNAIFNVLTRDGYIYTVNNNGQAGFGFSFLVNNKGFRDTNGNPTYKSVDDLSVLRLKDPRTADTESDITHKIFFNAPAADLPASAPTPGGSTTWLLTPPPTLTASNITFTGVEGSINTAGTHPAGGNINFTASAASNYAIDLDINNNGVYTDAVDRRITGTAVAGANKAYWDGNDGLGVKVSVGVISYNIRVYLLSGEVHFPFIDVENNPNGIIITRSNGSGAGNNIVYWDDSGLIATGTTSNPIKTSNVGISSAINGHKWGSTAYSGTDFGNENGLDTWAYVQSIPATVGLTITLREADLEVVSLGKTPAIPCQGQTVTYTTVVRNNGPSNVSGAGYQFTFPSDLTNVTVSSAVTTGTASVNGGSVSGNQYKATLNMNNAAVLTFTITGTLSTFPAGGSIAVQSAVIRPADVTDPDATNPDGGLPTDPQSECDAAPSGIGCNNIQTDVALVSQPPTVANAGAAQVLCAASAVSLTGNVPVVGIGVWSKISGPGNPIITNVSSAGTTVTGLASGVYVFRWSISNGDCNPSTSDVQITVQSAVAGNTITTPATSTFCGSGDPAVISGATPIGGSGTYTYQWQLSTDNINFSNITGATSGSYDPPVQSVTTYYRRLVTSGSCNTPVNSNVVSITIQADIGSNTITPPAVTSFCATGDADVIAGSLPMGGNGTYTYQWQSSIDNTSWSNLSGASNISYDPVPVSVTTYYRRIARSGSCTAGNISNVVVVNISPALTAGSIGAGQSFCVSGDPVAFTQMAAPTGGNGSYTYQWQRSVSSATSGFTDLPGITTVTYDAPVQTQTSYYRRITRSGLCTDAISNVLTVTVLPALTAGSIGTLQYFCISGDPAPFTPLNSPTGGNGTYTYQWQSSVSSTSSGFSNITGANGASYDAPPLSRTTYFRRIVSSGACISINSNVVPVTIYPAVDNNTISSDQTICTGTLPLTITGGIVSGGSGAYSYLWESNTEGAGFVPADGVNTEPDYTPPFALTQTTQYRRTVTTEPSESIPPPQKQVLHHDPAADVLATGNPCSNQSNIVQITVVPTPTVANAGSDQGPLNGSDVTLNANTPVVGIGTWSQVSGPGQANILNTANPGTAVNGLAPGIYVFRWTISNLPCGPSADDVQIRINAAPVAGDDQAATDEDVPVTINILDNDTDNDGSLNMGSVRIIKQPANGTLSIGPAGVVVYTPRADYYGNDGFTYTVNDDLGITSNTAAVSITISAVNDAPVAADDQINLEEDQVIIIPAPGVLDNDTDVDGDQLTATIVTPVSTGVLVLNGNGSFTYTPSKDFNGNASFSYRVCDASGACDTATVTLVVGNENDPPVAADDNFSVDEDAILLIAASGVLANDTDVDNDPLTANLLQGPSSGNLTLNADGSFRYSPAPNFNGIVTFSYQACDGSGACDTALVTITVNNINDAPVATDDSYSTDEDVPLSITTPGVLFNDTDIDGNALSVVIVAAPANGTLTLGTDGRFVYTPLLNYNGIDRFTYQVCDNGNPSLCDTGMVTITIRPVNDTVQAGNDSYTTAEDTPLAIGAPGVLGNDIDPEGDPLTVSVLENTSNGLLTLNANGGFSYVPNPDYNGGDRFTYVVCDPSGACDTAVVVINITPVNDAPVAGNISFHGVEDAVLTIDAPGLLSASSDLEGGILTASLLGVPGSGTVNVNADGSFVYTPVPNFNGVVTFQFQVCDDGTPALCDTATVTLTIAAVNDRPEAADDIYNATEDTPLTIAGPGVLVNDQDIDGDLLTARVLTAPANGSIQLNSDGSFTYTPRAQFNGNDTYTYIVCDGSGGCDTATVTILVAAVNDAPIAGNTSYTATEDVPLVVAAPGVLFNDSDPDGDALTAALVRGTVHGTLQLNADGSFSYVPSPNYNGVDSFIYKVCDPSGACDTNIVRLTVQAVNDIPTAAADTYTGMEDTPMTIAAPGVLSNDTDPDGDVLQSSVLTPPVNGQLILNGDGSFSYTPGPDYNGIDRFTYLSCDGSGACDTATVTLTINAVNDAPLAVDDNYTINEDNVLRVPANGVLFNDLDKEGNTLTASVVVPPGSGTLVLNTDGSFIYTPASNYNGTVTFSYRVCDDGTPSLCDTGTVTIQVNAVNDAPVGVSDSYTVTEDTPLSIAAPGLLVNDTDVDGDPLRVSGIMLQPVHGTLIFNAAGGFVYTPAPDYNGVDSFAYTVCDNNIPAACDTAIVRLTITADNDAPRPAEDYYTTAEDTPLSIMAPGILFNDMDPDGDPMTVSAITVNPAHGVLTFNADGSFSYTPTQNYNGVDTFGYRVCDNNNACATSMVLITVTPVNDQPVTVADNYTVTEDISLNVSSVNGVLVNDGDPDGDVLTAALVSAPRHGSVTLQANGGFIYTPAANFNGSDFFVYEACDPTGACVTDTAYLLVRPVNDTVQARNDLVNTDEDTPVSANAADNDDDPDGDILTYTLLRPAAHGTLVLLASGVFTYTPGQDYNGLDSALYRVCDPSGACDSAYIIINVGDENDPPVANPDSYTTTEDQVLAVIAPGVLANDTDVDLNTQLDAAVVTGPSNGTLVLQSDGSFVYRPNADFNGVDQFTYHACDANAACSTSTVTITVTPVNDAPVAGDDTFTVDEDTPLNGNLVLNDRDIDGNTLTAVLIGTAGHGDIILNLDGTFIYTPSKDFNGTDIFYYRVCDNGTPSLCDTATVTITVNPVNDVPTTTNDSYDVDEDNTLTVNVADGVLSNDHDVDGEVLVSTLVAPSNGSLILHTDGSFVYRPNPNFNGTDSFVYQACDLSGACAPATVTIIIKAVNDAPIAIDDRFTLTEDTLVIFSPTIILANDTDADGDALTARPIGNLAHGSLVANPDGTYTYLPAPNFNGLDSIRYQACDPSGACDTAIVVIDVLAVNDAPTALPDVYEIAEDGTLDVAATAGVLINDNDPDGEMLVSTLVTTSNGSLQLRPDGSFIYRPNTNFNGIDSFTYRACDVAGACDTAQVRITVLPVNDAPVATNDYFSLPEDTVVTFAPVIISSNDIDVDGDVLTARPIGSFTKGTLVANPDGTYTYQPSANFNGLDSIQYQVCDPFGACDTGIVIINIVAVNDAPAATNDIYSTQEDETLTIAQPGILANDTDVDGEPLAATVVARAKHGVFTADRSGAFSYVPNKDYYGIDTVLYRVCDLSGACDTAVVYIQVLPVADPPVAGDDVYITDEDIALNVVAPGLLSNDTDPDGFPLITTLVQGPRHGTVVVNINGSFIYTPVADFNGTDLFTYQVCDTSGVVQCDPGTVTITVQAVNDAPVAETDMYNLNEDTLLQVNAPGVLENDINKDGDVLRVTLQNGALHGQLQLNPDGSFTYMPDKDYNGRDSAVYVVCDPSGLCDTARILLNIVPVNDRPMAVDDRFLLAEDSFVTFSVVAILGNDVDPDRDILNSRPLGLPAKGSFTQNIDGTFTYKPNADFNGIDSVQYEVCDPSGSCDSAWIRFIIQPVNDIPVALPDSYQTPEDITLNIAAPGVLTNDTDVDGDILNISVLSATRHGQLTLYPDHSFSYIPDNNYNGIDSFYYIICDPGGLCDTAIATITVTPVNDAPVALDNAYALPEDGSISDNVLSNDSDQEGGVLTASLIGNTSNGSIIFNPDGTFIYKPAPNFSGTDGVYYRVCDDGNPSLCDTAFISFTITAVNDAPVAVRDTVAVTEDVPATGNVLTNDSDPEGDALVASLVTAPVNGTVVLNANGSFTYIPNANFNGTDSLTYQVCDNGTPSLCDTATVVFNVAAINDAPVAVRDTVAVTEDVPATGNVLTNDSDPEGDALVASLVTAPVNGTVVLNANGSFTYTPNANFNGTDSLTYQVCDNGTPSLCDTATVVFNVAAVNDAPVAVRDTVAVTEDLPATGNVLTNDSDPEGDALVASLVTAPVNGTVVLNANGSFTYIPNANFNGTDSLTYQVCDNGTPSLCDTATVVFNVAAVNDAPVAVRDTVAVTEDLPATGNVLTNDSDPEGNALVASLVKAPVNGTVVLNANGSLTYTPNANFNGTDSLTYQVCDNGTPSLCDTATVVFNIAAVNDAPVAVRDTVAVTEDVPATGNVLTNDSDPEGDALVASLVTAPVNGTVVLNANGSFTYTPNANFNGTDSLTYQVCDNGTPSLCDTATVVFNVAAINDAPVAVRDTVAVTEDLPATGNVLTNDSDPEGDALVASLVTAPVNGTVVLNANGSFTYIPNANFNGTDSLTYQVCDNGTPSLCDTATVVFNVSAVNDAPVAVRDTVAVTEDLPATGNVLTNDSDPEGDALVASLVTAPVNGTVVLNANGSFTYTECELQWYGQPDLPGMR
ncbi:Ig-like domain-containing protein [Chitinophaga sp. MD30]|uniref:Ig-like domain-containing protein n=1 Tax=Chitinophaga sp. MD30 TaxID=2033437 RepID=UPI000BAE7840|nr:Ig-like domain-containing protein [Chitinophaga sp. MD30]ASZ13187.1 hypothetical protein CK934_20585 [Chitinophaga sp. MD30]